MNKPLPDPVPASTEEAQVRWAAEYASQIGAEAPVHNRSGIPVKPLYTPLDVDPARFDADVGFPGQPPYTRGIYATMHRGRTWTQRQLIGLGTPPVEADEAERIFPAAKTGDAEAFKKFNATSYHQPSDEFHEEWDFSGMEQLAKFAFTLGLDVANIDQLPTWKPGDEFLPAREKSLTAR